MKSALLALAALTGCYLHSYPVTAAVADESTYRAQLDDGHGTAWAVAPGFAVTAGHVCRHGFPAPMLLVTESGRAIPATIVEFETSPTNPEADLCVLSVPNGLGRPLILASQPPPIGTPDASVNWGEGVHQVTRGVVKGPGASTNPTVPGASGAAVFTEAGVYMIVVAGDGPTFTGPGTTGTPVSEIRHMLDDVGADYLLTPPTLEEFPEPAGE